MKKNNPFFFGKCLLLLAPFFILLTIYVKNDPFMVLRPYRSYDRSFFLLNEHYVGWKTYMQKRDSVGYNSYILGNSCTMAFKCGSWQKYLGKNDRAIRLFGSAEQLTAVRNILLALDRNHAEIKNVLLVADADLLGKTIVNKNNDIVHIMPPEESNISELHFQLSFIQAFFSPKYLFPYIDYGIFHHYKKYMGGIINPYGAWIFDPVTRDFNNPREGEIKREGDKYWTDYEKKFPRRYANREYGRVIFGNEIGLLKEIERICLKHHTDIRIVVSPNYMQQRLNHEDLSVLENIFGINRVFDFSGKNQYASDIRNFYDRSHYRPVLGILLLKKIYARPIGKK